MPTNAGGTGTILETMLLNWLPVGAVMEEDAASPDPSVDVFVRGVDPYDGPMQDS